MEKFTEHEQNMFGQTQIMGSRLLLSFGQCFIIAWRVTWNYAYIPYRKLSFIFVPTLEDPMATLYHNFLTDFELNIASEEVKKNKFVKVFFYDTYNI